MTMPSKNTPLPSFGFHSLFARLFISVFLVIIIFAIAMILLAQLIHSNSDGMKSKVIAEQVVGQIEPFLVEVEEAQAGHNRLQARFVLAVVKKSFDIFDESLNAKIGLYDKNRRLILQTNNTDLPEHLPPTPSWLAQTLPTLSGREPPHIIIKTGTGYWVWYENRRPPKERPMLGMFNFLTGTILLVLMMTAVLWGIAHNMTWRLNQMSRLMTKMGDGDFSVRVNQSGNDEIAMLAYGFNQSAEKIEKLINANSLLLAHASHEFRTPITRIRLQIEMMDMLAQKLSDDDKAKFDKRANAINRDLTGLNDLVESILLVSRLDAGHALQDSEDVDFTELVNSECQHYTEVLLFGKPAHMIGQPKLLTHLIRNLINNALIHGVPPVEVYVYEAMTLGEASFIPKELTDLAKDHKTSQDIMSVAHDGTHSDELATHLDVAETDPKTDDKKPKFLKLLSRHKHADADIKPVYVALSVVDQGAGIAEDKREDIFSPFVRLKQEKKGSGLGLSLVAQIAEAHGGSIITDTWQGKTRFLVVLPTQPKSSM
ncbi:MAG: HAMP domain-containing sensor histidine kinase [Moraxella sp.]|uniref:HAMP domain-containing sensor histidine kinase n=1 Tax=Moraxella sp. TaxID=479 RepID=UPI0026DC9913|nr:HAMP domain-containing sensor histidine kinase [Moraxella sp.]MDO4450536.1 HAMP domain-containing sensor histidine kinase [Moraxella sp.]